MIASAADATAASALFAGVVRDITGRPGGSLLLVLHQFVRCRPCDLTLLVPGFHYAENSLTAARFRSVFSTCLPSSVDDRHSELSLNSAQASTGRVRLVHIRYVVNISRDLVA